ncbi:hypothetical protein ACTFIR_009761 [Dictyostelium discoideum]
MRNHVHKTKAKINFPLLDVKEEVDLPGMPIIPPRIEYVFDTSRSTNLAIGDVRVYAVEHVFAALKAYQIDNLVFELTNLEPPVGNGSSDIFVQMIPIFSIRNPIYWSSGDIHIVAHRHQYFWELKDKDQDVEPTKKQIYYSADDITRHVEEIVLRFIYIY